jgi:hypothetical protein
MMLTGANRAPATLAGAAIAGILLWVAAAHIDRGTTGGYWAAYGIIAGAGAVIGLSQLRGGGGHPPAMLLFGFLPVLIAAGWVIVGMQPHPNWTSTHVMRWSGDIGIRDLVDTLATWLGVLAFGIGFTFAAALEPFSRSRQAPTRPATVDRTAANEPTTAERRELAREREGEPTAIRHRPVGSVTGDRHENRSQM